MERQANRAGELAAQYQAGDRKAMEDLIQEIQDGVYYHCVKILRNESDAPGCRSGRPDGGSPRPGQSKDPAAFYFWLNQIIA